MQSALHTPLGQLTLVAAGYAGLVTLVALVITVRRVQRPAWLDHMVWILELLLAVRAVAGLGNGQRPEEMSAHIGYLFASVCVLPIAMQSISDDRGTWSSGVVTVAALAVTVVAVRLQMTWGNGA